MAILNQDGYLVDPTVWNRELASKLAGYEDIDVLTESQWQVIAFIRDYYQDFMDRPPIYKICAATGLTTIEICRLFPKGNIKSACRIAGLPCSENKV